MKLLGKIKLCLLILIILSLLSIFSLASDGERCLIPIDGSSYYACEDDFNLCLSHNGEGGTCDESVLCVKTFSSYCSFESLSDCYFTDADYNYNNYKGYSDSDLNDLELGGACDWGCCLINFGGSYFAEFTSENVFSARCDDYNLKTGETKYFYKTDVSCDHLELNCGLVGEEINPSWNQICCEGLESFNDFENKEICYNPRAGEPECRNIGTQNEGWYHNENGDLIRLGECGVSEIVCSESDQGNIFFYGYARNSTVTLYDVCLNSTHINESVCFDGIPQYFTVECFEGCDLEHNVCNYQESFCRETVGYNIFTKGRVHNDFAFCCNGLMPIHENETHDRCVSCEDEFILKPYSFEDYCGDDETLIEYYCGDEDEPVFTEVICQLGCENGRCIRPTYQCYDTDGGKKYFTYGNVTYFDGADTIFQEDVCINETHLREYFCNLNDQIDHVNYECPQGCDLENKECINLGCAETGSMVYFDINNGPIECCDSLARFKAPLVFSSENVGLEMYSCLGDTKHQKYKGICTLNWLERLDAEIADISSCGDGFCDDGEDFCTCPEDCSLEYSLDEFGSSVNYLKNSSDYCLDGYQYVSQVNPSKYPKTFNLDDTLYDVTEVYSCVLDPSESSLLNACPEGSYLAPGYNKYSYTCYSYDPWLKSELDCLIADYSCPFENYVEVLRFYDVRNSHAEMPNLEHPNFNKVLCCGDSKNLISFSTDYGTTLLKLEKERNSHVEMSTYNNYGYEIKLGTESGSIDLIYREDQCGMGYVCAFSLFRDNNSHVSYCEDEAFKIKACLKLSMDGGN